MQKWDQDNQEVEVLDVVPDEEEFKSFEESSQPFAHNVIKFSEAKNAKKKKKLIMPDELEDVQLDYEDKDKSCGDDHSTVVTNQNGLIFNGAKTTNNETLFLPQQTPAPQLSQDDYQKINQMGEQLLK